MRISIVTPSWNSAATIADTCRSIREQTHRDIEHILIDGLSKDATVEIAGRHARHDLRIICERDKGIYDAMNKGLRIAGGEVIGVLNSDDLLAHPRVLERVAQVMSDPAIDACFADLAYVDQANPRLVRQIWRVGGSRPNALSIGWIPPHPTLYLRRRLLERHGLFRMGFHNAADHEIMARLLGRIRIRAVHVPEIWVRMRLGGASNSGLKSTIRQNLAVIRSLRSNHIGVSPLLPIYKLLIRLRQRQLGRAFNLLHPSVEEKFHA